MEQKVKNVLVYRVVDRFGGKGLYWSNYPRNGMRGDSSRQPLPEEDRILMIDLKYKGLGEIGSLHHRYGFKTLDQLKSWLYAQDRSCIRDNFVIRKYVVPENHIAIGNSQVIFDNRVAKRKRKLDLIHI